jgi:L-alanine-DL-glutamate epimerase-like enolase superfamily enzyme
MRITRVECIPTTVNYKRPFVLSSGAVSSSIGVLLKLHTDEGIIGIGDSGHAAESYHGETQDSIISLIANLYGPQILLGEDPFNIEKIVAKMEKAVKNNNQSKTVVDYALWDIMGKKLGVPVYKLLGGKSVDKITLGTIINIGKTPAETIAEAQSLIKAGFTVLKAKVGFHTEEEDIENMGIIKQAVGPKIKLMIDANGAWNYYQALRILKQMEKYDLALCEQPLPWWDVDGLARLRRKVDIPIFPDESATELKHLIEIIEKDAADGLMLKVSKAGGILRAKKWVSIAKAAGLSVQCGCMTGSGFEAAAQAHFLISDEWTSQFVQENTGPLTVHNILDTVSVDVKNDLARKLPRYEDGCMWVPEGPGLGMELNEEVLQQCVTAGKKPVVISN